MWHKLEDQRELSWIFQYVLCHLSIMQGITMQARISPTRDYAHRVRIKIECGNIFKLALKIIYLHAITNNE